MTTLEDLQEQIKSSRCITYSDVKKIRKLDIEYKKAKHLQELQERLNQAFKMDQSYVKKLSEIENC